MTSVLITGGAGYFGRAFVQRLLDMDARRICIYSRDEHKHALMRQRFNNDERLRFFIGCVRDRDRLRRAMEGVDIVVHAAALKMIQTGHYDPIEMTKTNVNGASNVIEASMDAGVHKVIGLSTDKAFEPVSGYGHSKAMAESLFLAANNMRGANGPRFAIARYGNISGSTGSVIPLWRNILKTTDTVPVTDPECTRFWMKIEEAVDLVLNTLSTMQGGELVIPTLPAYRLGDLAEALGAKMDIRGLGKWEKRHESMSEGNSSDKARRMSVEELREKLQEVT